MTARQFAGEEEGLLRGEIIRLIAILRLRLRHLLRLLPTGIRCILSQLLLLRHRHARHPFLHPLCCAKGPTNCLTSSVCTRLISTHATTTQRRQRGQLLPQGRCLSGIAVDGY